MSTDNAAISAFQQLIRFLDDRELLMAILAEPHDAMDSRRSQALLDIARHFKLNTVGDGSSDDEGDRPSKKSAKRPRTGTGGRKPRHPWRPFLHLRELTLDPLVSQHLTAHGTDPTPFLNDPKTLKHAIGDFGPGTLGDAFMACYEYACRLEERGSNDRFRWCFAMLMFFDLVQLIRPEGSGRVGHLMQQDIHETFAQVLRAAGISEDMALKRLNEWSLLGSKINKLCEEFGEGCLFFLGELLSKDFLGFKFTGSGQYHDEAFAHLTGLGLKDLAKELGAQELGRRIRRLLIKPFKEAKRQAAERAKAGRGR